MVVVLYRHRTEISGRRRNICLNIDGNGGCKYWQKGAKKLESKYGNLKIKQKKLMDADGTAHYGDDIIQALSLIKTALW